MIPPLFGWSLRLVSHRSHLAWLARRRAAFPHALALALTAILLFPVISLLVPNVWYRMATPGVAGAALGFAVMHIALDVPVRLVAAFGAGAFWSAIVVKSRSAVPALVSHVLWDLAVLFWIPYA